MGSRGSRYFSFSNSSFLVNGDLNQMESCRVTPVRCDNMSRSVTLLLSWSLKNWIVGTDSRTGLSQVSLPSSTSMPADTAVNNFEFEAIWHSVAGVKGNFFS